MARWLRRISVSWGFGYLISAITQETDVVYSIEPVSCYGGTKIDDADLVGQRVGQHAERKQKGEADKGEHGVKSVK